MITSHHYNACSLEYETCSFSSTLSGATILSWKVKDQDILFVRYIYLVSSLSLSLSLSLSRYIILISNLYELSFDLHNFKFCSKKSVFDNKKAIRGGIPLVFRKF